MFRPNSDFSIAEPIQVGPLHPLHGFSELQALQTWNAAFKTQTPSMNAISFAFGGFFAKLAHDILLWGRLNGSETACNTSVR